jgi:DDE superfamily endonuclease
VNGSVLSLLRVSKTSANRGRAGRSYWLTNSPITLRRYLVTEEIVDSISKEHLRRILNSLGITAQRTRTWKKSNDPYYEQKKSWVLAAYKAAEAGTLDGVLVSFDECGPISLKPHACQGWFQSKKPARQRATYTRTSGVRKFMGAYDVGSDLLWGKLENRSVTAAVVLEFLTDIRSRYPKDATVYIVMDNLSSHWTPRSADGQSKTRLA